MQAETQQDKRRRAQRKGRAVHVLNTNGIEARRGACDKLQIRCRTLAFFGGHRGDWNYLCVPEDLERIQALVTPHDQATKPPTLAELLAAIRYKADKRGI